MYSFDEIIRIIAENKEFIQLEFEVRSLSLFGSMARGDNRPESDIDLLVDMPPKIGLLDGLKTFLEELLNSPVDLVRKHTHMSQEFLTQISCDAITII